MEKEYEQPEKSQEENDEVREPIAEYQLGKETLPVLTEEELADTITREELVEYIFEKIDKLPG